MTAEMDFIQKTRDFILERADFWSTDYLSLEAGMRMNMEVWYQYDRIVRAHVLKFHTKCVKGETNRETRTVKNSYEFRVFASWTDHLKFRLSKKEWIPRAIRSRLRLAVRYQKIVKNRQDTVPVSVVRMCPHANFKWDGNRMQEHIRFLFPERWDKYNA